MVTLKYIWSNHSHPASEIHVGDIWCFGQFGFDSFCKLIAFPSFSSWNLHIVIISLVQQNHRRCLVEKRLVWLQDTMQLMLPIWKRYWGILTLWHPPRPLFFFQNLSYFNAEYVCWRVHRKGYLKEFWIFYGSDLLWLWISMYLPGREPDRVYKFNNIFLKFSLS